MGLDVLVLPLHKYFSGEYSTALERMFPDKINRVGTPKAQLSKENAVKIVAKWHRLLREILGVKDIWDDVGEVVFSEQFNFDAWHAVRAFAANLDYPDRQFLGTPHNHPALKKIWNGAQTRFKHLIIHEDNRGFYFPTTFADPIPMDPNSGTFIAGSSLSLMAELNILEQYLGITPDFDVNAISDKDPLCLVKYGWAFMRQVAGLSVQHRLPIVFDG